MKLKLDENLPDRLVQILSGLGHDVDTVRVEHLTGHADPTFGALLKRPTVF